jgi:aminopeptidase-like protein
MRSLIVYSALLVGFLLLEPLPAAPQTVRSQPVAPEVIQSRLGKFAGDNKQREATLKQLFSESGCDDQHLSEQSVKGSKPPNLVCVLPGTTDGAIIVGAHFDHVSAGEGVVDNWSGASLLPSLYQSLKGEPRKHSYIFIGFTEEEQGEVGSKYYAKQMTKPQVAVTDAMVNMDTLGLASTKVWASHSDKQLIAALAFVAKQLNMTVGGVDIEYIGSTDSVQFAERKIPAITIHSLTQTTYDAKILHTSKDKLSEIHMDEYYQTYRLISAYLAFLDKLESRSTASSMK